MPLQRRILVFALLWLLAGGICAVFADVTVEAGESTFLMRLRLVYLAPLISAMAVAFTVVHGHYDTWQQREQYQGIVFWLVLTAFTVHAIVMLTRRSPRQFVALSVAQTVFLAIAVWCVLFFFHYDATHGHG